MWGCRQVRACIFCQGKSVLTPGWDAVIATDTHRWQALLNIVAVMAHRIGLLQVLHSDTSRYATEAGDPCVHNGLWSRYAWVRVVQRA